MQVRRIITGYDDSGRSCVTADERVEALPYPSGNEFLHLWGCDAAPTPDADGTVLGAPLPPPGGYRCGVFVASPGDHSNGPGMHRTDTIDVVIVLSGQISCRFTDGSETALASGDVLVQRATDHEWVNDSDEPAVLALFVAGTRPTP